MWHMPHLKNNLSGLNKIEFSLYLCEHLHVGTCQIKLSFLLLLGIFFPPFRKKIDFHLLLGTFFISRFEKK